MAMIENNKILRARTYVAWRHVALSIIPAAALEAFDIRGVSDWMESGTSVA